MRHRDKLLLYRHKIPHVRDKIQKQLTIFELQIVLLNDFECFAHTIITVFNL